MPHISKETIIDAIVQGAEESIFILTGKHYTLCVTENKVDPKHEVYKLLDVVAKSIGLDSTGYKIGKTRMFVELRCVGVIMIERLYPKFTMKQICEVFGLSQCSDHRIAMYKRRAQDYIDTADKVFMPKYEKALSATEIWASKNIKKHTV